MKINIKARNVATVEREREREQELHKKMCICFIFRHIIKATYGLFHELFVFSKQNRSKD